MDIRSVKGKGCHSDSPVVSAENRGETSAATGSDITVMTLPLQCIQWCVTDLTQLDMLGDLHLGHVWPLGRRPPGRENAIWIRSTDSTQIFVLNHHLLSSPCRDMQIYIDNNKKKHTEKKNKIKKLKAEMVENIYKPCAIVHITNCYKHSTVDQSKRNYENQ